MQENIFLKEEELQIDVIPKEEILTSNDPLYNEELYPELPDIDDNEIGDSKQEMLKTEDPIPSTSGITNIKITLEADGTEVIEVDDSDQDEENVTSTSLKDIDFRPLLNASDEEFNKTLQLVRSSYQMITCGNLGICDPERKKVIDDMDLDLHNSLDSAEKMIEDSTNEIINVFKDINEKIRKYQGSVEDIFDYSSRQNHRKILKQKKDRKVKIIKNLKKRVRGIKIQ